MGAAIKTEKAGDDAGLLMKSKFLIGLATVNAGINLCQAIDVAAFQRVEFLVLHWSRTVSSEVSDHTIEHFILVGHRQPLSCYTA